MISSHDNSAWYPNKVSNVIMSLRIIYRRGVPACYRFMLIAVFILLCVQSRALAQVTIAFDTGSQALLFAAGRLEEALHGSGQQVRKINLRREFNEAGIAVELTDDI